MYKRSKEGEQNRLKSLPKGKSHWRYDKKPSRLTIHKWLYRYYGKANRCENKKCDHTSDFFEWALIKGKKYERKRENFKMLCRKCHTIYDMTRSRKQNIINGIKKRYKKI